MTSSGALRSGHDRTLESVLAAQEGVLRIDQSSAWLLPREVHAEVAAGRWQQPCRGVVVAHNGELTASQRRWAALLGAPPGSAMAGLTALEVDGLEVDRLTGFAVPEVHVVIPADARKPDRAGARFSWSTHLDTPDVHPLRTPRRTRSARSIVDAAAGARTERQARAVVLAGVQQRLVRPADLRDALTRRGQCRWRAIVEESICDAEGGIASLPERDFDLIRRRAGLPEPSRQQVVRRRDGRYYLDVAWLWRHLVVEVHGVQHLEQLAWDLDLDRIGDITAGGERVLQVTSSAVRHHPERVGAQLLSCWRSA